MTVFWDKLLSLNPNLVRVKDFQNNPFTCIAYVKSYRCLLLMSRTISMTPRITRDLLRVEWPPPFIVRWYWWNIDNPIVGTSMWHIQVRDVSPRHMHRVSSIAHTVTFGHRLKRGGKFDEALITQSLTNVEEGAPLLLVFVFNGQTVLCT